MGLSSAIKQFIVLVDTAVWVFADNGEDISVSSGWAVDDDIWSGKGILCRCDFSMRGLFVQLLLVLLLP